MNDFFIMPRQSGKTTHAIYEFLKSPTDSILITFSRKNVDNIIERILSTTTTFTSDFLKDRILAACDFNSNHLTPIGTVAIFDEYLYYEKQSVEPFSNINRLIGSCEKCVFFSSPSKRYPKKIFDYVKSNRQYIPFKIIAENVKNLLGDEFEAVALELYLSILTNPNTNLITNYKGWNHTKYKTDEFKFKETLTDDEYHREILGELFF